MNIDGDVVKKKRGRKKKVEVETEQEPSVQEEIKEKPKSRRGRKTKAVVSYATNKEGNNMSDEENIIVKLNVRGTQIEEKVENVPTIEESPNAYHAINSFESTPFSLDKDCCKECNNADDNESCTQGSVAKDLRIVELLKDFEMKSKVSEWPQSTSIACYWCCHQFTSVPFGIPVKFHNDKFHVFGCCCSLECAAAYNFNSKESSDEIWERYNLLNLLSRRLGYKPIVRPAPPRLSLKMFGGHMDIESFREYFGSTKILSVNFPPMMTLTQQVEEINECDISSEYRYIPIDHDRINKYKEKLTLKRNKPLTNYKHTLDHLMNLKIN